MENTTFCTNCGNALQPGQEFCTNCGTPNAPKKIFCTNCGTELAAGQEFCTNCGGRAAAPTAAPAAAPVANEAIYQYNAAVQQPKKKKAWPFILIGVGAALLLTIVLVLLLKGPAVENITVSEYDLELRVDASERVSYTIYPAEAADAEVKWESSNSYVASVSPSGTITANNEGTCIITVTAGRESAFVTVTVVDLWPEEEQVLGVWEGAGYAQDGEVELLPYGFETDLYLYDDMTGKVTLDDSNMPFTWEYSYTDGEFVYYTITTNDGGTTTLVLLDYDLIMLELEDLDILFTK